MSATLSIFAFTTSLTFNKHFFEPASYPTTAPHHYIKGASSEFIILDWNFFYEYITLFINNQSLTEENSIRNLGIYIDSNLNWKSHIKYIAKNVKCSIGILSKLRYYFNSKTLLDLYYALVYPFLTYCIIAWGNTCQTSLQPLFVLQKKAIRIITVFLASLNIHVLFSKI